MDQIGLHFSIEQGNSLFWINDPVPEVEHVACRCLPDPYDLNAPPLFDAFRIDNLFRHLLFGCAGAPKQLQKGDDQCKIVK